MPTVSLLSLGCAVHPSTIGSRCVVSFSNIGGFFATMWSNRGRNTWMCCCEKVNISIKALEHQRSEVSLCVLVQQ